MKWLGSRVCRLVFAAGVVLPFTGCGSGQGTVTGKVTLDGKPLPGGLVSFYDVEDQTRSSGINKDGTYSVSNIAPGKTKVTVLTVGERRGIREPEDGSRAKNSLGEYVPIPAKYSDMNHSGLTLDVHSGSQPFDIALKDEPKTEAPK
jgi:hypothetical protein